jgi:hypothetical protein
MTRRLKLTGRTLEMLRNASPQSQNEYLTTFALQRDSTLAIKTALDTWKDDKADEELVAAYWTAAQYQWDV